jgi:hypothetical protein
MAILDNSALEAVEVEAGAVLHMWAEEAEVLHNLEEAAEEEEEDEHIQRNPWQ